MPGSCEADGLRAGEEALSGSPPEAAAALGFIGRIVSPWSPGDCPKNLTQARSRGGGAAVVLAPAYAPALRGLASGQWIIVVTWFDRSRRDLLVQAPRHLDGPRGTFALRSPNRPNPIALATVQITGLDAADGRVEIDAIDAFDGTPVLDLKPWLPSIDTPPG